MKMRGTAGDERTLNKIVKVNTFYVTTDQYPFLHIPKKLRFPRMFFFYFNKTGIPEPLYSTIFLLTTKKHQNALNSSS